MPTLNEIIEAAEARKAQQQLQQNGGRGQESDPAPREEDVDGFEAARNVVRETLGEDVRTPGQAARKAFSDVGRVATGLVGDPIRAGINRFTGDPNGPGFRQELAIERAKTRKIQQELGTAGTVAQIAGEGAMLAGALPNAAFNTIGRSMLTGGAIGGVDAARQELEQTGELDLLDPETRSELMGGMTSGAIGGALGFAIGSAGSHVLARFTGKGKALSQQAIKSLNRDRALTAKAQKRLIEADVRITQNALESLATIVDKKLSRSGITATNSRRGWAAVNALRHRAAQGGEISLQELNKIRRSIRDASIGTAESRDALKIATDEINRFIGSLRGRPHSVSSGNVTKGLAAWREMNKVHKKAEKADALARMFLRAENRAAAQGWSLDRALQQEAGILETSRMTQHWTQPERDLLHKIAQGTKPVQMLNRLDRRAGHGFLGLAVGTSTGAIRAATSRTAANRAAQGMTQIIEGTPARMATLPITAGIATGMQTQRPSPAPAPAQAPQAPQAGQAGQAPAQSSQPPLTSRRSPRPLTEQSQTAVPSMPEAPKAR